METVITNAWNSRKVLQNNTRGRSNLRLTRSLLLGQRARSAQEVEMSAKLSEYPAPEPNGLFANAAPEPAVLGRTNNEETLSCERRNNRLLREGNFSTYELYLCCHLRKKRKESGDFVVCL